MLDTSPERLLVDAAQDVGWQDAVARLEGAYDSKTISGYRRCYFQFAQWCRSFRVKWLPAAPQDVAAFIEHRSAALKPPSLWHVSRIIGRIHRLAGEPDPTRSFEVFLALRRAGRRNVYLPRQALGLTSQALHLMSRECTDDLVGLRDKVLLWVGFETLCRGSEIADLRAEDLKRTNRRMLVITIRKAKTDQASRGRTVVLSTHTADAVEQWLSRSAITQGPLLPRLDADGLPAGTLSVNAITRILRSRAQQSGLTSQDVSRISSHSLRVGGAQQLTMNNKNLAQIMRAGGWKSVGTVSRYIEGSELSLWEEGGGIIVLPVSTARGHRTKGWL